MKVMTGKKEKACKTQFVCEDLFGLNRGIKITFACLPEMESATVL